MSGSSISTSEGTLGTIKHVEESFKERVVILDQGLAQGVAAVLN